MCCLVECYQTDDGIAIPEPLRPYLGGLEVLDAPPGGRPKDEESSMVTVTQLALEEGVQLLPLCMELIDYLLSAFPQPDPSAVSVSVSVSVS